ncbi:MAG: hypothetical protein M1837_001910 [Sclerophora amabilis]|nr:MAG: hypothetical protein M1837_001910 [Sclerophora amabilis]
MDDDNIHFPPRFGWGDIVATGNIGLVLGFDALLKVPINLQDQHFIDIERRIYERLANGHDGVIRYYGAFHNGILLQRARHGGLRQFKGKERRSKRFQMRWVQQIMESVVFIHSNGVLHGDLSCNNVFLDDKLSARLGDFAGSSIDGVDALVAYEPGYAHPSLCTTTVASEIFALGSMIYEIFSESRPNEQMTHNEIEKAFAQGKYPELRSLGRFAELVSAGAKSIAAPMSYCKMSKRKVSNTNGIGCCSSAL